MKSKLVSGALSKIVIFLAAVKMHFQLPQEKSGAGHFYLRFGFFAPRCKFEKKNGFPCD